MDLKNTAAMITDLYKIISVRCVIVKAVKTIHRYLLAVRAGTAINAVKAVA
ncbi:hypothetical protein MCHI_003436 [Candidatus Magnetoovum chiemensis]|nr:hypothetical protein MCHI_003436 [Candidatus Magnetoovum chiemensis]